MNAIRTNSSVSAFVHGWVGRHSANASLYQDGDRVSLNGRVGDASVSVTRFGSADSGSLVGSIHSRRGSWNVSVFVSGSGQNRRYNGSIGREFVSLRESPWGQDGVRLSGWIGSRFVNATAESRDGFLRFDGQTGPGFEGRTSLSGSQSPAEPKIHHEALIPLLALGG